MGGFLSAIAGERAVLLVLDDLQWADPATLDLLVHVSVHRSTDRLLMVGAYRDDEISPADALVKATTELHRRRLLATVALGPLPPEEVAELAGSQLDGRVDAERVERLHAGEPARPGEQAPPLGREAIARMLELAPRFGSDLWLPDGAPA